LQTVSSAPRTVAEASEILAQASAEGRTVRIGSDLRTEGLDRIVEHEASDLTCVAEAGVRLSTLQAALGASGQRLALDPPGDPSLGACVAANLSGPLRHAFGTPRDLVLGATLVLSDGLVVHSGGKVVKNVAGYDLARLVCGSHGRLALIATVALRLHPVPAASATAVVESGDSASVVRTVLRSQLRPSALDVLHPGRVVLLFEGVPSAVERQVADAHALVGARLSADDIWEESRAQQAAARGRLLFAPGDLPTILDELPTAVVRPSAGVAYVPFETTSTLTPAAEQLVARLRAQFDPTGTFADG
jgi:glycolate oxidase FAD binding subunit